MTLFNHLIGSLSLKRFLQRCVEESTLPSTLLFHGKEGVGKSLFALAIAKALLQTEKKDPVDLYQFHPEGKLYLHSVEAMRSLKEEVYKPPFTSPVKVFIIHEADRMLPTASNALLKTIEEPTPDTYLILLSSKKESLLPTILSRCSCIAFPRLPDIEVVKFLQTHHSLKEDLAKSYADLSEGSLGVATLLATSSSVQKQQQILFTLLSHQKIEHKQIEEIEKLFDTDEGIKQKQIALLFSSLLFWQRDLHILHSHIPARVIFKTEEESMKNCKPMRLLEWETLLEEMRKGLERGTKFSHCLEAFLLGIK